MPSTDHAAAPFDWDEFCPDGAIRYYEGDDPEGFDTEMFVLFGIDVTQTVDVGGQYTNWKEHRSFFIPPGLVGAIYGDEWYPLGS